MFEREGRLPPKVVQRRLEEDEDLGDIGEREALDALRGRAQLGDRRGAAGGDGCSSATASITCPRSRVATRKRFIALSQEAGTLSATGRDHRRRGGGT